MLLFRGILVFCGLTMGLGAGEILIRWINPRPPVQVIRSDKVSFGAVPSADGTPVWHMLGDREHYSCAALHPERDRIMIFGDSIAFGSGAEPEPAFPALLEQRLNTQYPVPGFCVMNFATPGFGFDQSWAIAQQEIPRWKPKLVFWEIWGEGVRYVMLGKDAYSLAVYVKDRNGYPFLSFVPEALNWRLFLHSRMYQFAVLRWGATRNELSPAEDTAFLRSNYAKLTDFTRAHDVRLAIFFPSPLDRPFKQSIWNSKPQWMWEHVYDQFSARDVSVYDLPSELADQDFEELRADPCCHFNAQGHRVLAQRFEPIVANELNRQPETPHTREGLPINVGEAVR